MKIGVMLRAMSEKQGIGIYSRNLMDEILRLDDRNEYVLFYRDSNFVGRYADRPNVKERLVQAPNKIIWDQVRIPALARSEKLDVLFHTKFTLPFLAPCKTVMTIHGSSWFVHPELYRKLDIAYINRVMPLYCRKASAILSNSGLTTRDFVRLIGVPDRKITTVHLGTGRQYRVIEDMDQLEEKRRRFGLPRKFILSVIKYDPRKNFENLIAAFRLLRKQQPCKLVVTGIGCEKYIREYGLDSDGTSEDVHFLGWVDQEDLPYLYNMARCLFFPSVYEEFGIPTCEAMACGCPPVVSNTGALPEIAGKAGMIVDPFQPEEMCGALSRLWNNDQIYNDLRQRCLCRAPTFTWENCAAKTLEVLTSIQEN